MASRNVVKIDLVPGSAPGTIIEGMTRAAENVEKVTGHRCEYRSI